MQIKPCVCGRPAKARRFGFIFHAVECSDINCPAFTPGYRSPTRAIELWESEEFRREVERQISLRAILNAANLGVKP